MSESDTIKRLDLFYVETHDEICGPLTAPEFNSAVSCQHVYQSLDHLSVLTFTVLVTPPKETMQPEVFI